MSDLFHFLTDLATNPRQQVAFANTPEALMEAAGLSKQEQAVVTSGNSDKVAVSFMDERFQPAIAVVDPNPDPLPDPDPPHYIPESVTQGFVHQYA
ncbi:MAG: hypothetical protein DRR19_26740 [Candidatus Parabeggiatoa sp. nov. 1]|nr:MAG: hypothetical protein DRR19_26740 [Gammaproteobacteria bacterium]